MSLFVDEYSGPCLNALRDQALNIAVAHGFKDASVGEDLALIHSEVSEALEEFREGRTPNQLYYTFKSSGEYGPRIFDIETSQSEREDGSLNKPCGIPSEMADIVIRVLHFCGKHGIDIEKAVEEKMTYNESRPYKHGGKKL